MVVWSKLKRTFQIQTCFKQFLQLMYQDFIPKSNYLEVNVEVFWIRIEFWSMFPKQPTKLSRHWSGFDTANQ